MTEPYDIEKAQSDRRCFLKNIPDVFRIHIGGEEVKEGWYILNARPEPYVNIIGNATDLDDFPDECCDEIYASHIIEHLGYMRQVMPVLKSFFRLLKPGGVVKISVPDLTVLCHLYLDPSLETEARFHVMRMIYGGQTHEFDYHYGGYNLEMLGGFLHGCGFADIVRVQSFGLFDDTSIFAPYGREISLNVQAIKPLNR